MIPNTDLAQLKRDLVATQAEYAALIAQTEELLQKVRDLAADYGMAVLEASQEQEIRAANPGLIPTTHEKAVHAPLRRGRPRKVKEEPTSPEDLQKSMDAFTGQTMSEAGPGVPDFGDPQQKGHPWGCTVQLSLNGLKYGVVWADEERIGIYLELGDSFPSCFNRKDVTFLCNHAEVKP